MADYIYPKIKKTIKGENTEFETTIRVKRNSKWYDVTLKDMFKGFYLKTPESFIDRLVMSKMYYEPNLQLGNIKPSKNQEETTDDLLDDSNVNRIKGNMILFSNKSNPQ